MKLSTMVVLPATCHRGCRTAQGRVEAQMRVDSAFPAPFEVNDTPDDGAGSLKIIPWKNPNTSFMAVLFHNRPACSHLGIDFVYPAGGSAPHRPI
jgi:hypothetical protein